MDPEALWESGMREVGRQGGEWEGSKKTRVKD